MYVLLQTQCGRRSSFIMTNIAIKSPSVSFRRFADFIVIYLILLHSIHAFTTMHVTCGTDVELSCPIRSTRRSDEIISWFRPNSSHHRLSFISIGDILFPEYTIHGRFNLISLPTLSRLTISHVHLDDQGLYTCKSSSSGQQYSIKLFVNARPHLSPSSPLLLYPVNRTFSITCSLLCDRSININEFIWFMNGERLNEKKTFTNIFTTENLSFNTQRLTIDLKQNSDQKLFDSHFLPANYTCQYDGKETTLFVRRRTKEELHRLPRQEGSSSAYLFQIPFDTGINQCSPPGLCQTVVLLFLLWLWK